MLAGEHPEEISLQPAEASAVTQPQFAGSTGENGITNRFLPTHIAGRESRVMDANSWMPIQK